LFRDLEFTDQEPPVRAMLTSNEQFFLELMNAARLDPLGEAARQGIDLNAGLPNDKEGWKEIAPIPVQPLAPNAFIQQASADHGQWMLDTDTFSHTGAGGSSPGDRIVAALTGQWTWGENLAIFNTTGNLDLGAVIKEGIGGFKGHFDGLYESPGHRVNIFEGAFRETGVAQVAGEFTAPDSEGIIRDWNASTITNKFGTTGTSVFLTGVIYDDTDTSGLYSVGEGRDAFQVSAAGIATATWAAGGYTLALDSNPAVTVTLGTGASAMQVTVDLSGDNVKLDLMNGNRILTSGDVVLGDGATEVQMLGAVDNAVTGNASDNFFYIGRGDNVIDGGGGFDTVVFTGRQSDFTVVDNGAGQFTVMDQRSGPASDGTNTVSDVAALAFTDTTVSLLPDTAATTLTGHLSMPDAAPAANLGLRVTLSDGSARLAGSDASGDFSLGLPEGLTGTLDTQPGAGNPQSLTIGDALDVLRLAVGLPPSFGPATPHDLIAADVDFSGRVAVDDALNVLRAVVGLETPGAAPGEYVLLTPGQSLDGMTHDAVSYDRGFDLDHAMAGSTLDLQVVMLGDTGATQAV
jgi:hypothetical protein